MKTTTETQAESGKMPSAAPELPASELHKRAGGDATLGIVIAIIVAALFWPVLVGAYVYFSR